MSKTFVKFLLVGGLNTLFGYLVFSLGILLGAGSALALALTFVLGVVFNFHSTGRLVFRSRDPRKFVVFAAVYTGLYLVNLVSLRALRTAGLAPLASQAILVLPMALLSFFSLARVFSRNEQ